MGLNNKMDIVITLVYSIVMLLFMIYPSIKITDILYEKFNFSKKYYNITMVFLTIFFSLFVGIFLKFV